MSEQYIILAQSPDGAIGVYGESDDNPSAAIVFNSMDEVRHEISECLLLQGLPIQIVKLDLAYILEDE